MSRAKNPRPRTKSDQPSAKFISKEKLERVLAPVTAFTLSFGMTAPPSEILQLGAGASCLSGTGTEPAAVPSIVSIWPAALR